MVQRFGFSLPAVFIACSRRSLSVPKPAKQNGRPCGDHSSIWDSWPIAFSGCPRGPSLVNSSEAEIVTQMDCLWRSIGIAHCSGRFCRSVVSLFDSANCFLGQLRLALSKVVLSISPNNLRRIAERGGLEEILKRPAAGQVNADTTSCFANARTDLEQLRAQSFDLRGAQRRWQLPAK